MTSDDAASTASDDAGSPPVYLTAETLFAHRGLVIVMLRRLGIYERHVEDLCMAVLETAYFRARAGAYFPDPERDPEEALKAWLFGFAWHVARRHQNKASTRYEVLGGLAPGEDIPVDPRAQIEARDAVAVLRHFSRDERGMLLERADGDTYISIADRRGHSTQTAFRRVREARALLRAIIDKGVPA